MNITNSIKKYIAQRNWRKLCILVKIFPQAIDFFLSGTYTSHIAFACNSANNQRYAKAFAHLIHKKNLIVAGRNNHWEYIITYTSNAYPCPIKQSAILWAKEYGLHLIL